MSLVPTMLSTPPDGGVLHRVCETARTTPGDLAEIVRSEVERLAPLCTDAERTRLVNQAIARLDGLDVIDDYLADPLVDEVMINDGCQVWVERAGVMSRVATLDDGTADAILERVVAPLGRRVDRTQPIVDARLPSGARLCAVVPPVAIGGICLSIRRHRRQRFGVREFTSDTVAGLLTHLVGARANLLVTGATSSGKTSLLAAMLAVIDPNDRVVVIEDTAELPLDAHHAIRLEARPSTIDTVRDVALDDLVVAAMRLRPDRIVVGEFRGPEVLAVVQALNTGHDGSLSTCHANSARRDGLALVETLVMQAAPSWPLAAIRDQVGRSIDAVIHVGRLPDGRRQVVEVAEVVPPTTHGEPLGVRPLSRGHAVVASFSRGRR